MPDAGDQRRMTRTIEILRHMGVTVYEQAGWQTAGGTFVDVPRHNIDHHDASSVASGEWGAHGYCLRERICNTFIPRCLDGKEKVSIIACGTAPHSGVGSWTDVPSNQGNSYMTGTEKGNSGSERYTDAAYRTQIKLHFASWLAANEQQARDKLWHALGHKEYGNRAPGGYPGRKTDPSYDMNAMRNSVNAQQLTTAAPAVNPFFNPNGAIYQSWQEFGKGYGPPTRGEEQTGSATGGVHQWFGRAVAWWNPAKIAVRWNTLWTNGSINKRFVEKFNWVHGPFGYPTTNEMLTHDGAGAWQKFEGGICVWHPSLGNYGAFFVTGGILSDYMATGGTGGVLGYPTDEEFQELPGVHVQPFTKMGADNLTPLYNGEMVFSGIGGRPIYGRFHTLWRERGGPKSSLGLPTMAQQPSGNFWYQDFNRGSMVWDNDEGVPYIVESQILEVWKLFDTWGGVLGMPTAHTLDNKQSFKNGSIEFDDGVYKITVGDKKYELKAVELVEKVAALKRNRAV